MTLETVLTAAKYRLLFVGADREAWWAASGRGIGIVAGRSTQPLDVWATAGVDRMSVEEQKQVVCRFFEEVWNQRHRSVAAEIISPDCITHQLRSGTPDTSASRGPEILSAHVAEWLAAFPDIHFSVDQVVAERDLVAVHCTATGTHTGSWLGIPPTGRQITIRMAVTYRLADGMIAEDWVLVDFLGVFQQLGLVRPTSELLQRSRQTEAGQS